MSIHLGYEVTENNQPDAVANVTAATLRGDSQWAVSVPMHHMMITGITQLSGKTTAIEGLLSRMPRDFTALVFRTKRNEVKFAGAHTAHPFYRPEVDWEYVRELLEAAMKQRLRFETSWIIRASKGASTLREVYANVQRELDSGKLRGIDESMYTNIGAYFDKILPQLEEHPFASKLELSAGINVMELGHLSEEVQALVISSCLEDIQLNRNKTIVVIPEAWSFLPQSRGNPVKWSAQRVIRQGGASENYMWLDSQDVTTVTKDVLKSVGVWILGIQREFNEVKRVLEQIPTRTKPKTHEVMNLPLGHFYVAAENWCKKVYAQPAWSDDWMAWRVSIGILTPQEIQDFDKRPARVDSPPGPTASLARAKEQLETECITLQQRVLEGERALARAEDERDDLQVDRDTIKARLEEMAKAMLPLSNLRTAIQAVVGVQEAEHGPRQAPQLTEEVIQGIVIMVANRLGQTPTVTMVAPLEAMKKQYQREAVDRLAEEAAGFPPRVREAVKWLESVGKTCSFVEISRNLDFPTTGGSLSTFSKGMKELVDDGWLAQSSNGVRSTMKAKVEKFLAIYEPTTEDVEQTFAHLVAKLGEGTLTEDPQATK